MDNYLSSVVEMALWWTPEGFLPCDGRKLSIRNNEALFSLLGDNYGGDGVNDFALPDLRPVDANGVKRDWKPNEIRKMIVVQGVYPMRP
jgi:microcystin-dependent protein